MSKFIIAIIACVSLSGCFYQTVNQYDINRAIALCGSVANIHQIYAYSLGSEDATCYSGEQGGLGGIKGERK